MAMYHLRPVSASPSPTATTLTPPGDHSPHYKHPSTIGPSPPPSTSANSRLRRPMSPSSLKALDIDNDNHVQNRNPKFPAPPTGHDLMAMFPPAAPDSMPEMRPGPTSGYFQDQERAFFAKAGKEIIRVRVEVDLPHGSEPEPARSRPPRQWPVNASGPSSSILNAPHHSPAQSSTGPVLYPHSSNRPVPRGSNIPITPSQLYPGPPSSSHPSPPNQLPPNLHPHPQSIHPSGSGVRTPPDESITPSTARTDDYEADDSWRTPTPYADRRRAGKHTKRVVVRT